MAETKDWMMEDFGDYPSFVSGYLYAIVDEAVQGNIEKEPVTNFQTLIRKVEMGQDNYFYIRNLHGRRFKVLVVRDEEG